MYKVHLNYHIYKLITTGPHTEIYFLRNFEYLSNSNNFGHRYTWTVQNDRPN